MEKQVLKDINGNNFYSIEMKDEGWLFSSWHGKISEEKVKAGGEKSLEVIQETGCPYLINDNTHLEGSWLESNDWLEQVLIPKLYEAGLRYVAHIYSSDFITKFSAVDLETRIQSIHFKLFSGIKEAEEWIQEAM